MMRVIRGFYDLALGWIIDGSVDINLYFIVNPLALKYTLHLLIQKDLLLF